MEESDRGRGCRSWRGHVDQGSMILLGNLPFIVRLISVSGALTFLLEHLRKCEDVHAYADVWELTGTIKTWRVTES